MYRARRWEPAALFLQIPDADYLIARRYREHIVRHTNNATFATLHARYLIQMPERADVASVAVDMLFYFNREQFVPAFYKQIDLVPVPVTIIEYIHIRRDAAAGICP